MAKSFALVDQNGICLTVVVAENESIALSAYKNPSYSAIELDPSVIIDNLIGYPYPPQQEEVDE